MKDVDEDGILGTRPPQDLGPLFTQPVVGDNAPVRPPDREPGGRLRGGRVADALIPNGKDRYGIRRPRTDRERAALLDRHKALLEPHVLAEAARSARAIPPGFMADDIRAIAIEINLGTGEEADQREWSWIGPWLAVLARRGRIAVLLDTHGFPIERPSTRPEAHSNSQACYTAVK